jgi:hypothetical protein
MANTGMDTPTGSPRTEDHAALLTEKQTCAYLNVSKRNLYCWRMAGTGPLLQNRPRRSISKIRVGHRA